MDERNFDALLRRALMDANLERFQAALDGADGLDPAFSSRYLRQRMRLLADPFGWAKKAARPVWKQVMRNVACILLACTLALGALMAASPTVRAAVLNWLRELGGGHVAYTSTSDRTAWDYDEPPAWRPTWLPEGWNLEYLSPNSWSYQEENGSGSLTYACYTSDAARLTTNVDGETDAESIRSTIQVRGCSADYYQSERYRVLVWEDRNGYLFMLRGSALGEADFLKIAESISFYEGPDTAYGMGWVPPEYEPMYRDEVIGAAEETWTYNQTTLTWRYITNPICPFATPDGEPEEVTVNGLTGWYWDGEEPEDSGDSTTVNGEPVSGSTVMMGGVSITVSTSTAQANTLVWTDPETNTAFLLEGVLDRYDLLRMAESITEQAPEPSEPAKNAMVTSGTAYGG